MNDSDSPFERMDRLMNEMNGRLAAMGWGGWGDTEWGTPALESGTDGQLRTYGGMGLGIGTGTNLNVERDEDGYTVLVDTPGFERDELDVRFHDGSLRISGTHEDDAEGFHSRRFSEDLHLDDAILDEEISARYHNGVLEIRVPTADKPEVIDEGRRIEIDD